MPKDVTKKENKENKENKNKHFFKDFKAELKKVIWPTPKQLVNNTIAVITIVIITAVIVFALDLVFEVMNDYGINKLRDVIATQNTQVTDTNQEDENATVNETLDSNSEETNNTENNEAENNTVNE